MDCTENCLALAQGFAKERELLWALGEQTRHLRILRQTGVVRLRKTGTKSYYSMNAETAVWDDLYDLLGRVCAVVHRAREKGAEKWT